MSTYVQVMPLVEIDGEYVWTTTDDADAFFGVYVGRPGEFQWEADEDTREEAMKRADAIAESRGIPPQNVFLVGESQ